MTDIPRPAPGDTDWVDWADDEEATSDTIHAATDAATPSTLIRRDAAGRAKVVDGTAAGDIATKGQLDTKVDAGTITKIEQITQAAYTALGTKVATTLYVIVG